MRFLLIWIMILMPLAIVMLWIATDASIMEKIAYTAWAKMMDKEFESEIVEEDK